MYLTMLSYYLKGRKNTESENPKVVRTESGRIMVLSNVQCVKSKFLKEQETRGLLSSWGIKTRFSQIPLLGLLLFWNI